VARRRTEFGAFVLDLAGRRRGEAVGAIPVLRDRLRENEPVQANFILVRGKMIEERWASEWWDGLGKIERGEFRPSGGWPFFVRW
jgi:hypothetical protein